MIGGIGLIPETDDSCELGYWLGFEYWGQGYATEACKALLDYTKANTSFKNFRANVYKGNVASSKVLEKIQFAGGFALRDAINKLLFLSNE